MAKSEPVFVVAQWQHNSKGIYTLVKVGVATKYIIEKGSQRWTLRIGKSMYRLYPYKEWQKHKKRGLPRAKIVPLGRDIKKL
jgi:hypothetical protein